MWLRKVYKALPIIPEYLSNDKKEVKTDTQIENTAILIIIEQYLANDLFEKRINPIMNKIIGIDNELYPNR